MTSCLADFEFLGRLGAGSFGSVHKVRRKADGLLYVVKQISIGDLTPAEQRDSIKEVHIMASLDHPNVVRYYDSFIDDGMLCIVMEYCDRGDLQRMVKKLGGIPIPEDRVWIIFLQVCFGLAYLHSRRTLHRDLKSANIFMCARDIVKIGDLGVARVLGTETFFAKTCVGTPFYLSPELIEGKPYNEKSDVWAAGCVLYELCTGRHAFDAKNQGALILKIIQGSYPPISEGYSDLLRGLVDSLLTRDSRRRPTLLSVLMHPDVADVAASVGLDIGAHVEALLAAHAKASRGLPGPGEEAGDEEEGAVDTHDDGGDEDVGGDEEQQLVEGSVAEAAVGLGATAASTGGAASEAEEPQPPQMLQDSLVVGRTGSGGSNKSRAGAASHVADEDAGGGYGFDVRGAEADNRALALYEGMVERVEASSAGMLEGAQPHKGGSSGGGAASAPPARAAATRGPGGAKPAHQRHPGGDLPARRVRQVAGAGSGAVFGTATLAAPTRRVLPLPPSAQEAAAAAARRAQSADGSARGKGRSRGDSGAAANDELRPAVEAAPSTAAPPVVESSRLNAIYAEQVAALPDQPVPAVASPTAASRPRSVASRPSVSMLLSVAAGLAAPLPVPAEPVPAPLLSPSAAATKAPAPPAAAGGESGASDYDDDFESDDEGAGAAAAAVAPVSAAAASSTLPSSVSEASGAAAPPQQPHHHPHRIHLFGYPPLGSGSDAPAPEVEEEVEAAGGGEDEDDDQQYTTLEGAKIVGELLRERQEVLAHYTALKRRFEAVVAAAPLSSAGGAGGPLSPGFGTSGTLGSPSLSADSLGFPGGAQQQLPPEAYLAQYRLGFYEGRLREIEDDLVELGLDPAAIRTPLQ